MFAWVSTIFGIVLVDLILSGDNALVVGAAAARLPRRQRLVAILCGGGAAIILRILFTSLTTVLLQFPFLGVAGGLVLLFIALRLLIQRSQEQRQALTTPSSSSGQALPSDNTTLFTSILTILVADVTMSLDNVLAVGGLASGNLVFLVAGLAFSVLVLLVGSSLVAACISRLPWLLDLACLVVAWTAAHVFLGDDRLQPLLEQFPGLSILVYGVSLCAVVGTDGYLRIRDAHYHP